jgi:ADP-ribose pyrophosphatase YjhB (NUDIX family)
MVTRVGVDCLGRHVVEFDDGLATLLHSRGDRRCRLHEALLASLAVGGVPFDGARAIEAQSQDLSIHGRQLDGPLSVFACRHLSDFGRLPAPGTVPDGVRLRTDVHSHFSGCLRPADLLAIGLEADVSYPTELLAEVGVRAGRSLALREMAPAFRARVLEHLSIPLERRVPFSGLERIYRFRSAITKHPGTFVAQLRQVASDYAAMGIGYVELSLSNVVEAARLAQVLRELPGIEEDSGVTVRFLAALSRHDDVEWDLDYIDRLVQLRECGYIVGLDFMGMESNSTRAFVRQLRAAAEFGIPLRVHAGENRGYPENVRLAVETVVGAGGRLRVGHGLYGGDARTLALLAETGTIVEFNLNSNLALNNIQAVWQVPLARYVEAGVPVVLGTDGYGMYGTSPQQELAAAARAGLGAEGFAHIVATEEQLLSGVQHVGRFQVPPDPPPNRYTPEVGRRRAQEKAAALAALEARLVEVGVPLLTDAKTWLAGRRPLSLGGAWKKSWARVSVPQRASVETVLREVLADLDPERYVLVSGGTGIGVEGVAGMVAREVGLPHLGALVATSPPESVAADCAVVVGETLFDKAAGLYEFVASAGGVCVFIGGGNIVSDEIQTARNLRIPYFLMAGPEGAAHTHAIQEPHRAFRTADELLAGLAAPVPVAPLWRPGVNPAVDAVVVRAAEVLLVRRGVDAPCEAGKWALPGGFLESGSAWDEPWSVGEAAVDAVRRELLEETGLVYDGALHQLGVFEGQGRDPRDTDRAWVRSTAFLVEVSGAVGPLLGGDDAADVAWFAWDALPRLAFDHARILAVARARLRGGHRKLD